MLPTSQNINGRLTIGENIADNGGVKESFKAYKKYLAKHDQEEERVPGFEQFDNHQLFYIGYAHVSPCPRFEKKKRLDLVWFTEARVYCELPADGATLSGKIQV